MPRPLGTPLLAWTLLNVRELTGPRRQPDQAILVLHGFIGASPADGHLGDGAILRIVVLALAVHAVVAHNVIDVGGVRAHDSPPG